MLLFAWKNIKSLIKEYKAIFTLFFTVFSLVAVSLLYLHSFNRNLLKNSSAIDHKSRTYRIMQNMEPKKAEALIKEIKANISANTEGVLCCADKEADVDGIPAVLAAAYAEVNKKQIALDRGSLEFDQSKMQLIMDDIFYLTNAREEFIHDKMEIDEEAFTLSAVGHIGSEHVDGIIPMTGLQRLNLDVGEVRIVFERRLSHKELRILQGIVGEEHLLRIPPKYSSAASRQFAVRFFTIFTLVFMAATNVMGIYRYLVMRRKKEFLIYKIYGIRNGTLITVLLLETMILVTLAFFAGVLLFTAMTKVTGPWLAVAASPALFLQTYVMIFVCSILGIVPILRRIWKKSIFSEYVREEE